MRVHLVLSVFAAFLEHLPEGGEQVLVNSPRPRETYSDLLIPWVVV